MYRRSIWKSQTALVSLSTYRATSNRCQFLCYYIFKYSKCQKVEKLGACGEMSLIQVIFNHLLGITLKFNGWSNEDKKSCRNLLKWKATKNQFQSNFSTFFRRGAFFWLTLSSRSLGFFTFAWKRGNSLWQRHILAYAPGCVAELNYGASWA